MSAKVFSLKAELLWKSVPVQAREAILSEVWCGRCRKGVPIVDYFGKEVGGDVVLEGRCGVCGGRVGRHVEISQAPPHES
jgi:thiol-disulfide isomerase/thioredoxin